MKNWQISAMADNLEQLSVLREFAKSVDLKSESGRRKLRALDSITDGLVQTLEDLLEELTCPKRGAKSQPQLVGAK